MNNKRFAAWLLLLLVPLLILAFQGRNLQFNSDIRSMLPHSMADELGLAAREQLAAKLEGVNFLALGHVDKNVAIAASLKLADLLAHTAAFDSIVLQRRHQGELLVRSLFPYRFVRLSKQQQHDLGQQNYQAIVANAQAQLWSPASAVSSDGIIADPLFLFSQQLEGFSALGEASLDPHGYVIRYQHDRYWVLLELQVKANVFSPSEQTILLNAIDSSLRTLAQPYPELEALKAGLLFHADAATKQAKSEMSTIGLASVLLICMLIMFFFRSLRPLFLAIAALFTGLVLALAVVSLCFEELHLLTLVFGASLIGIAIDYAFHFCAEHAGATKSATYTLKQITPALLLSASSTIVAYLAMLFVPMPGIRQMALFCALGLLGSALALYLLAPVLAQQIPAARWPQRSVHLRLQKRWILLTVALLSIGLLQLNTVDDVRQLRGHFPILENQQQQMAELFQNGQANQFFLVRGSSAEQILSREQALLEHLKNAAGAGIIARAWGLSEVIPTLEEQQLNQILVNQLYLKLPVLLEQMGLAGDVGEQAKYSFAALQGKTLTPESFLLLPSSKLFSDFWITHGEQQGAIVSLFGVKDLAALQQLAASTSGVDFVDPVAEISDALSFMRGLTSRLLIGVLLVVSLVLCWRLGVVNTARCLMTPLLSVLVALAAVAWTGQGLSLFHILALLLVFGVGLDYALFYQFNHGNFHRLEMATSLAALSTLLAFGLLALSATPALAGFGLVVLCGIACSYFLAPQFNRSDFRRKP
ncbi:MMPL family transporter [Agarivorans sp. TSD2052]|uniref:MMPL family transporter n=1 Tax=Agarivorans sp. TSD2052 TaxID=2937286 RepID=UPI00200FE244|nr:MMPL family transporter [Agarivorans sp. TSD2052]UPW19348.1 MMPL family transporter [Agarivorans sp. TSD2052]